MLNTEAILNKKHAFCRGHKKTLNNDAKLHFLIVRLFLNFEHKPNNTAYAKHILQHTKPKKQSSIG